MKRDVVRLVVDACRKFRLPLSLAYFPSEYQENKFDLFSVSVHGKYIINFSSKNFYDIPRSERMNHFLPLVRVGLAHNSGEKSLKDQIELPRRHGQTLIRNGTLIHG